MARAGQRLFTLKKTPIRRRNIGKKMKKNVFICDKVIIFYEDGKRWMLVMILFSGSSLMIASHEA